MADVNALKKWAKAKADGKISDKDGKKVIPFPPPKDDEDAADGKGAKGGKGFAAFIKSKTGGKGRGCQ